MKLSKKYLLIISVLFICILFSSCSFQPKPFTGGIFVNYRWRDWWTGYPRQPYSIYTFNKDGTGEITVLESDREKSPKEYSFKWEVSGNVITLGATEDGVNPFDFYQTWIAGVSHMSKFIFSGKYLASYNSAINMDDSKIPFNKKTFDATIYRDHTGEFHMEFKRDGTVTFFNGESEPYTQNYYVKNNILTLTSDKRPERVVKWVIIDGISYDNFLEPLVPSLE